MIRRMEKTGQWMIYGANGYTGELTARLARERGFGPAPILAGRNADAVGAVASRYGMERRVFALDTPSTVDACLDGVSVVLNCAGPFSRTARPMVEACLRTGTHYLDITGELGVFESVRRKDAEARAAGVMLMPGAGFDVVPSDCLAAWLAGQVEAPTKLTLAFRSVGGQMSHGTATTMVENLHQGAAVRRDGELVKIAAGSLTREVDYGRGPTLSMAIPWGDLSTAFVSTGIPNVEIYMAVPPATVKRLRRMRLLGPLLNLGPVQEFMKKQVEKKVRGPSASTRERTGCTVWGEVTNPLGQQQRLRLRTPNGYALTVTASLGIVDKLMQDAPAEGGFYTASMLMGAEYVLSLPGVVLS